MDVDLGAPNEGTQLITLSMNPVPPSRLNITTDGFTADEADTYIATIEEQFGNLDNFEINGETLSADEVNITTSVVPNPATNPLRSG
ncbi:MAG: hypothetical protein CM1200mP29_14360 [Verrucomicrobiota bacterium]|nr:MAG: hypothetical protein CM1200mP29_14360 [Verrucomicrobiota bacterium]